MLKTEQAKAHLAQWRLPEDQHRLKADVQALPTDIRELAETIFELRDDDDDESFSRNWQEKQERRHQAALELDHRPPRDRAQVFAAIAPQLAPAMEHTWQLLKTIP